MKTRCGKYITIYKLLVDSKYTVEEWYKGDGRMYLRKKKVGSKTCTTTYSKRLIRETICYQGNSENYEERKYNVDSRRYQLIRKTWKSLRTLDEVHSSYFEHEEEEVLKSVVHYRCGIKHGECVTYTNPSSKENLVGVLVENYRYDLRHGEVKEWDEKGRLIVKRYDNDKLIQEQWTFPLHFLPHLFFLLALITVISTI